MAERQTKPAANKAGTKKRTTKNKRPASDSSQKPAAKKRGRMPKPDGIHTLGPHEANIHMLLYGDPGSEKTRTAGTSGARGLLMNCDGASGPDSILASGMESVDCENLEDALEVFAFLKHGTHEYEWVWLDSITLLQEKQMDKVLGDVVQAKPHRDPDVPDVHEYLKVQNQLKRFVRDLTGLRMNVGITAHVLRVEDEDDGTVVYWPAITGKLMPQKICGYMGIVGYMSNMKKGDDTFATMRVQRTDKIYAKDRYGAFRAGLRSPSVQKIETAVHKAIAASGGKE